MLGIRCRGSYWFHVKVINGEKSTINNKRYYGFKTVDEMVQMLSDQHTIDNVLTRKFPVRLLRGWNGEKLVPAQDAVDTELDWDPLHSTVVAGQRQSDLF